MQEKTRVVHTRVYRETPNKIGVTLSARTWPSGIPVLSPRTPNVAVNEWDNTPGPEREHRKAICPDRRWPCRSHRSTRAKRLRACGPSPYVIVGAIIVQITSQPCGSFGVSALNAGIVVGGCERPCQAESQGIRPFRPVGSSAAGRLGRTRCSQKPPVDINLPALRSIAKP